MVRNILLKPALISLFALLANTGAHAEIIQYNFTANNGYVALLGEGTLDPESIAGGLREGDTLHGTISYDTEKPADLIQEDPDLSSALYMGNITLSVTFDRTGYTLSTTDAYASKTDGHSTQPWNYGDTLQISGPVEFFLSNLFGTAFSDTKLPTTLSLVDFDEANVRFSYYSPTEYNWLAFNTQLTSLTRVGEVPEPATYSLLALGLGLMGVAARRKSRPAA